MKSRTVIRLSKSAQIEIVLKIIRTERHPWMAEQWSTLCGNEKTDKDIGSIVISLVVFSVFHTWKHSSYIEGALKVTVGWNL